jgi:hypothetical protein
MQREAAVGGYSVIVADLQCAPVACTFVSCCCALANKADEVLQVLFDSRLAVLVG